MQTSLTGWLKQTPTPTATYASVLRNETDSTATAPLVPPHSTLPRPQDERADSKQTVEQSKSHDVVTTVSRPSPYGRGHHPSISFVPATPDRINEFKRINSLLLPIPYSKAFYEEITADAVANSITLLAVWTDENLASKIMQQVNDVQSTSTSATAYAPTKHMPERQHRGKVIGGIRCRLLPPHEIGVPRSASYKLPLSHTAIRQERILYVSTLTVLSPYRSLGVASQLLSRIETLAASQYGVERTAAHTWEANEDGRAWYARRGFREVDRIDGYYRQLTPTTAFLLVRDIAVARDLQP